MLFPVYNNSMCGLNMLLMLIRGDYPLEQGVSLCSEVCISPLQLEEDNRSQERAQWLHNDRDMLALICWWSPGETAESSENSE